ncbi:hypothetical protein HHL16_10655 [Pseudoflavitalea sp. G-6-1-2]|uniref:hypothetical protein n=1 Tax=Pseudoflavitalea sp. G-6-1-2 TaxID=2728841 RepID=UPI00146C2ED2|nr:hypothetical protein [Pseudoflavitalea sp. G-6-1-2]NML21336.1 hypothetical protein [Pseudoflavitalea sp. G-6-1-2]
MKIAKLSSVTLAAVLAFGAFTTSCNKVKDAIKVNVPLQQAEYTFDLTPVEAGTHTLAEYSIRFNVDSAIKANASQFDINNIKSVKISQVKIAASNTDGENHFGLLSACKAQMKSDTKSEFVTIGELNNNPETAASSLDLPVKSDLELKDYFKGTQFSYVLSATVRKATTKKLTCKATVKFDVTVGL